MVIFFKIGIADFSFSNLPLKKEEEMNDSGIIIKFDQSVSQTVGEITKIIGLIKPFYVASIIDALDLEANPRDSKIGPVTDAIQDSIVTDKALFPFKTKGILLASTDYELLERHRVRLFPSNKYVDGILDGGHNTLAIGMYLLQEALELSGKPRIRGKKTWDEFKKLWHQNRPGIERYLRYCKENEDVNDLDFLIPVELLIPKSPEDYNSRQFFVNNLLDICAARNNNVQLKLEAKANQSGYFDALKNTLKKENEGVYQRIEWKTNDGGVVKAQDYIALVWLPLSLVEPIKDNNGAIINPPAPTKLYSGKAKSLESFEKLMSSDSVTSPTRADSKRELSNPEVSSAFTLAAELPAIYDYIYERFPDLYNANGGSYGRIKAVKEMNRKRRTKRAPFSGKDIGTLSPDGFIAPLFYGVIALMERVEDDNGYWCIKWKVDPMKFLEDNLGKIVGRYSDALEPYSFDPQKVGKAQGSYNLAVDSFRMALAGIL